MQSEKPFRYVNLGCGTRFHPDWVNMDVKPAAPGILACDLSHGIPLGDKDCDVVYHSHLLEHLRIPDTGPFMKECFRVLKPGGILRVVVPDLETICRLYLEKLEGASKGDPASAQDYYWMMLEMYDQVAREHWRSAMWEYLQAPHVPNEAFVRQRIGEFRVPAPAAKSSNPVRAVVRGLVEWLQWFKPVRAMMIGRFRLSGENHHWMYDRYSLAQLMLRTGFENPTRQSASSSLIPEWTRFNLDTTAEGSVYKPDSLFMEAVKPRS